MEKVEKDLLSEHVTFRIKKRTLDNLKSISGEENISLNTFVNQIFDAHINWNLHAAQVGWVAVLKSGIMELIKHVDKETIAQIAKNSAESGAKEIALYMRGKYGIEEWISILKDRARISGFSVKEYDKNGKTTIVKHHDMGENWSIFFKTYYETVFNDLGIKVNSEHTENSVMIELEEV